jgi:hypothetical protein
VALGAPTDVDANMDGLGANNLFSEEDSLIYISSPRLFPRCNIDHHRGWNWSEALRASLCIAQPKTEATCDLVVFQSGGASRDIAPLEEYRT